MERMKIFMAGLGLILITSCGSNYKDKVAEDQDNSETIEKDYLVRDASSKTRPGWTEDATVWAEKNDMDIEAFRYFSFETEPKVGREIACNLAKANARADIAAEITTFIQKQLASSEQGRASIDANNPETRPLRDFVENTLAEKIQGLINGASVMQTYWEKRHYQEELGAKRDFTGFSCATLIRMEKKLLDRAIERAAEEVVNKADDPEVKENVQEALKNINEDFQKLRG